MHFNRHDNLHLEALAQKLVSSKHAYCTRPVHSCGLFPILDNAFGLSHETQKELVASYGDQPWEVCQEKVEDMIRERKARMESCRVSMSF